MNKQNSTELDKKIENLIESKNKLMESLNQLNENFHKHVTSVETGNIDEIKKAFKFFARMQRILQIE